MTLNLVGYVSGQLTVTAPAGRTYVQSSKVWRTLWQCKCLCGKETIKTTDALRTSKVQSCGCCEWHIHHKDAYISWMSMKQRCDYKENKDYANYGGRGITYEPRWIKFVEFYKDMGDPPSDPWSGERMSLDRIDNNSNYTKNNCKWSTRSEQQLNKNKYFHSR